MRLYFIPKPIKGKKEVYVILKYKHKSQQVDFSPSIKTKKNWFGDGKSDKPILTKDPDHLKKNEVLRLFKEDVNKVIFQLNIDGIGPLVGRVREELKKSQKWKDFESKSKITLDRYPVQYVLEKYSESYKKNVVNGSYSRSLKYRIGVLSEFIQVVYKSKLEFFQINTDFYEELKGYLISVKSFSNPTISKIIGQFRQFLVWSKKNKYVSDIDTDFRTKLNVSYKNIVTLSEEQIKQLENFTEFDYELNSNSSGQPKYLKYYKGWKGDKFIISEELRSVKKDKNGNTLRDSKGVPIGDEPTGIYRTYTTYEITKDLFLFSISTGLRWSDVIRLKVIDYDFEKKSFNVIQKKTNNSVQIVENILSKKIWMKYSKGKSHLQYVFPLPCKENDKSRHDYNTKINHHLKRIGEILHFKKMVEVISMNGKNVVKNKVPLYSVLSFHMGRRTHSTIGVQKGVDPFTISKQLGHQSISQTSVYVGRDTGKLSGLMDFIESDSTNKSVGDSQGLKDKSLIELKSKLKKLKFLFDSGDISKKIFEEREKKLLEEFGL